MDSPRYHRALIADDEPALAVDLATRLGRLWPELDVAAVVHHGPAAFEARATAPSEGVTDTEPAYDAAKPTLSNCRHSSFGPTSQN
jgi:hypothetical protein